MNEKKLLIAEYKQKARVRYKKLVATRKSRRGLSIKERFELWKKDRQSDKRWKQKINEIQDKTERKAQKKGYKLYKKLLGRKYVIITWLAIILTFAGIFGSWYYNATRPLTAEQRAARQHSLETAREVMDEGTVLLRNEHATLPLKTKKVSVFGTSAAKSVYGGGGAGGIAAKDVESLYGTLDASGIEYDRSLYDVYSNYAFNDKVSTDTYVPPTGKSLLDTLLPNIAGFLAGATKEMPIGQLPDGVLDDATHYSDTAVYAISRVGTETQDLRPEQLRLTDDERATLDVLDDRFAHVVVLLNTTNVFELGFVEKYKHIDSVLWIGAPGEVGMHSVAKVLSGEVNPSGKLTDTYAYDISSNPAVANTGDFQYTDNGTPAGRYFVNYRENIYVGYRYYETFIDAAKYNSVVQYPFGYGLSYSTFDWNVVASQTDENIIRTQVTVANTGKVAGKEVVQVYYQPPFEQGGIEKASTVLGGYAKTKLLQPGESETVTVEFPTRLMASYDNKAWVLDKGAYQIRVAKNVHETVANFTYQQSDRRQFDNDEKTGTQITNRFDNASGGLTYFSRSNAATTFPTTPSGDDFKLPAAVAESDYIHKATSVNEPTTATKNDIQLQDLKGAAYDDPKWQSFVEQFTDDELVHLAGNGGYWSIGIDRLGVLRTSMYDGPASIRNFLQAWATVAYPIPANLAASWNDALAENVGQAMGKEARSFNVDAVYAPSVNLHRTPLGGRNFEY
jgi:beta-glucosidase